MRDRRYKDIIPGKLTHKQMKTRHWDVLSKNIRHWDGVSSRLREESNGKRFREQTGKD